ncbi:MAG: protease modulator HflC [Phycisphaerales bacterium]|nr:MAG: protease modulator HflC [Phycisphaerales bacterium]
MKVLNALILLFVIIIVIFIAASAYTINEWEQAVITRFGRPVAHKTEAGLYFRKPFIEKVHKLEKRLLPWDGDPENMPTRDKKRIFIDVWARWRITDPLKYYQTLRTEQAGHKILDDLVDSRVRDVIGKYNLIEAVRSTNRELTYESEELEDALAARQTEIFVGRTRIEEEIRDEVVDDLKGKNYGLELVDVHIKRVNYIESVRNAVYERMKSERDRIARLFESEAQEERDRILGQTRKEVDEIEGEMEQRSAEIRGGAEAEVIQIYAEAIEKSPEFYEFLRRLEAYRKTLGRDTRLILSTDSEFLRLLNEMDRGKQD